MLERARKLKNRTLFDPGFVREIEEPPYTGLPYSFALDMLEDMDLPAVPEIEVCVFAHVVEQEICAYEPRGSLYGPLTFGGSGRGRARSRCCTDEPLRIPSFVEPDVLPIVRCEAKAVLLVEDPRVFDVLVGSSLVEQTRVLLMTGHGIPRLGIRRLIHRLEQEYGLPTLLLTDSDTWGYWIYSVLKRGLMAPGVESEYAAIRNVTLLGARAGDWRTFVVPSEHLRPWERQWSLRLRELRKQRCFQSKSWQTEFDRFAKDRCGLNLRALLDHLGVDAFIDDFLKPRIAAKLKTSRAKRG